MNEQTKEAYLAHHGIKGQKWGVRRYQNEDGTLTAEGRERYLSNLSDSDRKAYEKLERTNPKAIGYVNKQLEKGRSYQDAVNSYVQRKRNMAGAAVLATAVIGSAAALYITSGKAKQHISMGSSWLKNKSFNMKNRLKYGANVKRI